MRLVTTFFAVSLNQFFGAGLVRSIVSWAALAWAIFGAWATVNSLLAGEQTSWWWLISLVILAVLWTMSAHTLVTRVRLIENFLKEHSYSLGAGITEKVFKQGKITVKWNVTVPKKVTLKGQASDMTIRRVLDAQDWFSKLGLGVYALDLSALSRGVFSVSLPQTEDEIKRVELTTNLLRLIASESSQSFKNYSSVRVSDDGSLAFDPGEVLKSFEYKGIQSAADKMFADYGRYDVEQENGTLIKLTPTSTQAAEERHGAKAYLERLWGYASKNANVYSLQLENVSTENDAVPTARFEFSSGAAITDEDFEAVSKVLGHNLGKKFGGIWIVDNLVLDEGAIVAIQK